MNLFINSYTDPDPARNAELLDALSRNRGSGLNVHCIDGRPTLDEMFAFINERNERSGDDDVNILANADIYFDDTIKLAESIKANEAWCLTRWEWQNKYTPAGDLKPGGKVMDLFCDDNGNPRIDSTDAWVWRGPYRAKEAGQGGFTLGVCGCDNRLNFLFYASGYQISNPSKTVKCYHLHESGVRRYSKETPDRIGAPHALMAPHFLGETSGREIRI